MNIQRRKKEIESLIDEYHHNGVQSERVLRSGNGLTYKNHVWEYWHQCHIVQQTHLDQLKEDAKREILFLNKFKRNLHRLVYDEISVKSVKGFGKKYVAKQGSMLYLTLLKRLDILRKVIKDEK